MVVAQLPANEQKRLKALNEYFALDTLPESVFDAYIFLFAQIAKCDTESICFYDLDRHWLRSNKKSISIETIQGLIQMSMGKKEQKNGSSFPDKPIDRENKKTTKYAQNSLKTFLVFPIVDSFETYICHLGILADGGAKPDENQTKAINLLISQFVEHLEFRKKVNELNQKQIEQKSAYADLEKFSYVASHDLRSPLNNIIALTQILKDDYCDKIAGEGRDYINFLNDAARQLADLVAGILEYSKSSQLLVDNKENINVRELIEDVTHLLHNPENIDLIYSKENHFIYTSRIAIKQILLNLCDNAVKHNDKEKGKIEINFEDHLDHYTFYVKDNGPGIAPADQSRIFELFERVNVKNKEKEGIGVGLTIVKRLLEKLSGTIKIQSELHKGTTFIVTIKK